MPLIRPKKSLPLGKGSSLKKTREWGKIIAGEVNAARARGKVKKSDSDRSKQFSQKVHTIENTLDEWYELDYFKEYDERLMNEVALTKYYTETGETLERS
jgi:hypothetical protein